jgi:hypothetical protein
LATLCAAAVALCAAAPAPAAFDDPLFVFSPQPPPPPAPPTPPPNGYLNGPCGLAVDSSGRLYVSDHYHDVIDVFTAGLGYVTQLVKVDPEGGPCGLALDSAGNLYVNSYHREVTRFGPSPSFGAGVQIDSSQPTGVSVDAATDNVYVNNRTYVSAYDPAGNPLLDGPDPLKIGVGTLGDGYGVAVSAFPGDVNFPASAGRLYVPDASDDTVKVYDPATDAVNPVEVIDGAGTPNGEFVSLRESAIAVDRVSGDVYVVDNLQPANVEQPQAAIYVFDPNGAYRGRLKYNVVHGEPTGLAVDNSAGITQGRVFVTSGHTHFSGVYLYPPNAATKAVPLAPTVPPKPLGGDGPDPPTPIGGPASPGSGIACEGDACQVLPPEPVEPTLTTLLRGLGNPKIRYRRFRPGCRRNTSKKRSRRCGRANRRSGGNASTSTSPSAGVAGVAPPPSGSVASGAENGAVPLAPSGAEVGANGLLPGTDGFDAAARADGGGPATLAGSHPYSLEFGLALDQSGGDSDLRELTIDLPSGLLANPAATSILCSAAAFATPRTSPFEASVSGESCPDRSQVGTIEVASGAGAGETRRFGLFNLEPGSGSALRLAASPFGLPLVFDASIRAGGEQAFGLSLAAFQVPQALQLEGLRLSIWGTPWDASHNGERGNCLNEAEPAFPWSKCSIGEPLSSPPLAFLTLPTECGQPLSFAVAAESWQQQGEHFTAQAVNRDSGGTPAPMAGCQTLVFDPHSEGLLSVKKASSPSGFVFRFTNDDSGLANPRGRIGSHAERAVVELPDGVSLNPSLAAGLGVCAPAELARESAFNPPGAGCPNASKIGIFSVRSPFYEGLLKGGVYLAKPDNPATSAPGAENPFDSLLAVYLIAKSADRGILISLPGELRPDPGDGTIAATFEGLPQIPYTDLEINFRSGQRAPLVSPPRCGDAVTRIELFPSSEGESAVDTTDSEIEAGIDLGPCPNRSMPPFAPGAVTGGVNSNVGSYTPYYVHLSREDDEQELTSYSLVLPKGITGRLRGIPFCPEAAIAAARIKQGFDEIADPSCPAASQVGRTDTGYGVGPALTYAPGRIYLAGPFKGSPLSLVTINAATVGPFDLGTIVIRSAFDVDERTAQLQIDSSASDPIPHILRGVPLHLRDIRVYMDRFQFTHNPSSCEPSALVSTITGSGASFSTSADDSTATVSEHFQLLNCLTLGFRPKLGLRLRGSARRGGYPSLRATFASRGARDSNLKRIAVEMPHALFLAQNHIRTVCTREQFAAQSCPKGSVYGKAVAHTLLFDEPLHGNVYLRSSSSKLPDLVADLHSGAVRIVLEGRIGPGKHGGILAFFDELPDAPIDRFTMTLNGGRRGLLQSSSNICANPPLATVSALGQNNIGARFSSVLRGQCKR